MKGFGFTTEEKQLIHDYIIYSMVFGEDVDEFSRREGQKFIFIADLLERLDSRIVRENEFSEEVNEFYNDILAEYDKTVQREIEMSAGDAIGSVGENTAIYHDLLIEAMAITVKFMETVEKLRKYQNDPIF